MTAKYRIAAIRLAEKLNSNLEYAKRLGICFSNGKNKNVSEKRKS